jgi:fucose permease
MLHPRSVLTAACFASFFAFGFIDNMKGPILPLMLDAEQFSLSQGGNILLGAYLGFITATMLTGLLADAFGNRRVLLLAGVCLCIGLGSIGISPHYGWLMVSMFTVGLGLGAIELGANGYVVEIHSENPGRYLNLLATFHGVGSFLVPIYVSWVHHWGATWQSIMTTGIGIAAPLTLLFLMAPSLATGDDSAERSKRNVRDLLRLALRGRMLVIYVLISSYVAIELGVAAWLMKYLQQVRNQTVTESSYYLSGFFVAIMLGRLLGSLFIENVGYLRSIGIALLGGWMCLSLGFLGPDVTLIAIPLSGLFFSIVFPTLTAFVTGIHRENVGAILGVLFMFGGLGGAFGPWVIGWISEWQGLQIGICSSFGFIAIALMALVTLGQMHSHQSA